MGTFLKPGATSVWRISYPPHEIVIHIFTKAHILFCLPCSRYTLVFFLVWLVGPLVSWAPGAASADPPLSGPACIMQYLGFCLVYNFKHFVPSAGYNHSPRCAERFTHTALSMVRSYIFIWVSGIWGMTLSVTVKGSLPPLVNNNVPREPNWKSICSHYVNYLPLKMTFILCQMSSFL